MSYRQNRTKTRILTASFIIVVLVAVIYFSGASISRGLSSFLNAISLPVLKTGQNIGENTNIPKTFFSSKKELQDENQELKDLLESARLKLLSKELLFKENKELKKILNRNTQREIILGAVLARPNQSLYDTLIIDIGYADGVEREDLVLVSGEIIIGKIIRVYKNSSVMELFSSSGKRTNVLIGDEHISAIAKGRGGMNFSIDLPRDVEIKEGDIVQALDINMQVLGEVEFINKDISSPFQTILFRSPVNIQQLRWVEVVKTSSNSEDIKLKNKGTEL